MQSELAEIRRSVRNAIGAIESNQVVDKDVLGTLTGVLARIDALTAGLSAEQTQPVAVKALEIDELVDELLDAQQDINLAANSHMDQSLCDASALIDKVEAFLLRIRSALVDVPAEPVGYVNADFQKELSCYDAAEMVPNDRSTDHFKFIPVYTSPPLSREGEDTTEVLEALKEAVEFANKANNYIAGQDLPAAAGWLAVIAKVDAALAATRSVSASTSIGGDHG